MKSTRILERCEFILNYTNDNLSLCVEHKGAGELTLVFLHYWSGSHHSKKPLNG
jgi:hypothetical protein